MRKSVISKYSKHTNRDISWLGSVSNLKPSSVRTYWAAERNARGASEFYACVIDNETGKRGKLLVPSPMMSSEVDNASLFVNARIIWIEAVGFAFDYDKKAILVAEGIKLELENGEAVVIRSAGHNTISDADGKMKSGCKMLKSPLGKFQAVDKSVKGSVDRDCFMTQRDWGL